jgi:hypothetical protein
VARTVTASRRPDTKSLFLKAPTAFHATKAVRTINSDRFRESLSGLLAIQREQTSVLLKGGSVGVYLIDPGIRVVHPLPGVAQHVENAQLIRLKLCDRVEHSLGVIRNPRIFREPGLLSAERPNRDRTSATDEFPLGLRGKPISPAIESLFRETQFGGKIR